MSDDVTLTETQKQLIEKLGVAYEHSGIQPAAARISSLLIISPNPELTFDQIRTTLNLSKSATSNGINMLLSTKKIEYLTKPGDRKRYFRSKITFWKQEVKSQIAGIGVMAKLMEEVLEQRPGSTVEFNAELKKVIDFTNFLANELPKLYKSWEANK